jgi:hypothetical protein
MKGVWIEPLTMRKIQANYPDLNAQEYQCSLHDIGIKKIGSPVEIQDSKYEHKKWYYKVKGRWFDESQVAPIIDPAVDILNELPTEFTFKEYRKKAAVSYYVKKATAIRWLSQVRSQNLIQKEGKVWKKVS